MVSITRGRVYSVRLRYGEASPEPRRDATDIEQAVSAVIVQGLELSRAIEAGRLRVAVLDAEGRRVTVEDIRLDAASGFEAMWRFLRESGQCP